MMAQNASPLFHDDVMLVMLTSRYPSHCRLHHCWSPRTFAAIFATAPTNHLQIHVVTVHCTAQKTPLSLAEMWSLYQNCYMRSHMFVDEIR